MTIHALVSGTLYRAPEQRTAKTGKPFVTGTLRVPDGNNFQFVRFIAFSETAQNELLRLDDGDATAAQGSFKVELYEKDGEPRISLSLVADHVLTLRRPPKARKDTAPPIDGRARQERYFDDAIPFGEAS